MLGSEPPSPRADPSSPVEVLRLAMPLVRERMKRLTDVTELLRFLFTDDVKPNEKAGELIAQAGSDYLRKAADVLERVEPWGREAIEKALDEVAKEAGLNRTKAWQPIRAAVTGSNVSPPLPESLELLGREATVARLRTAVAAR